jgi:predicted transcriptional regulator
MSQPTTTQLNRVYWAVDYMTNLEGQDSTLVIEMSQAMINDLIERGELKPMLEYVRKYCDVIEDAEDAERIAEDM